MIRLTVLIAVLCFAVGEVRADATSEYDGLLQAHVHGASVDYRGLKSKQPLIAKYVQSLAVVKLPELGREDRLALWINAYNACTLSLVLEHFGPELKSITDIPEERRWKDKRWNVGGELYSLDEIEHKVIRPRFNDARIHAAINCASVGCPRLRAQAYRGDSIDNALDEQFSLFVNDSKHVVVRDGRLHLSAIFNWFKEDFDHGGKNVIEWILRYAKPKLQSAIAGLGKYPPIQFIDYDWSLNIVATDKSGP